MSAPVISIGTPYSTMYSTIKLCNACDVCGGLGCLDSHGLCGTVNPEQTEGCFREPMHEGRHTFELNRAITVQSVRDDGHDGWCGCERCEPNQSDGAS